MTSRDFTSWFSGFLEISGTRTISEPELVVIKAHLEMALIHDNKDEPTTTKTNPPVKKMKC